MNKQLDRECIAKACVALCVMVLVLPAVIRTVVVTASAQARAVAVGAPEGFEVASIKQNKEPVPGPVPAATFEGGPGRFRASKATLRELIASAYDLFDHEIVGAPSWAGSDRFDVVARFSPGEPSREVERLRGMLRALLAERFNLVAREEPREMPTYLLVLASRSRTLGARLRPFTGTCATDPSTVAMPDLTKPLPPSDATKGPQLCISGVHRGRAEGRGVSLSDLATTMSRFPSLRRRVIDRTGLTGLFDYDVEWSSTLPSAGAVVPADRPAESGPDFFTALQEQLGLKLESGKESLRALVIDSVSPPSPD